MMSKEELLNHAKENGYKPEILEKVHRLLETLAQISEIPYLRERLALKGGTALNLFCFDAIPRLSVDIDLNYIGSVDRNIMMEERPIINDAISEILLANNFESYRNPSHYAGGKMVWRYNSALGQKGNLEIDLNYMYRQPLLPFHQMKPKLSGLPTFNFPILDIHELAAGKLSALFTRTASRDLFDAHHLLMNTTLDDKILRYTFVIYMGMTSLPLNSLSIDTIQHDIKDLKNRLLPVLNQSGLATTKEKIAAWADKTTNELRSALSRLLPLKKNEESFIQHIRDAGEIKPELLVKDKNLQHAIRNHPALLWAVKRGKH